VSTTPLKLVPEIASRLPERMAQLPFGVSAYVAILLWNQEQSPVRIEAEPDDPKAVRIHVPCSWAHGVADRANGLAADQGLTRNALVEAL